MLTLNPDLETTNQRISTSGYTYNTFVPLLLAFLPTRRALALLDNVRYIHSVCVCVCYIHSVCVCIYMCVCVCYMCGPCCFTYSMCVCVCVCVCYMCGTCCVTYSMESARVCITRYEYRAQNDQLWAVFLVARLHVTGNALIYTWNNVVLN